MTPSIAVALCADKNIEVGLHVTLYSLLESSHHFIKIYFIQKNYKQDDIRKIHKTLAGFHEKYELNIIEFDDILFSKFRGLHGNKFAYTRIMLANILSEERIIYLDSDLLIRKDLGSLFFKDLNGHTIAVSGVGSIEYALENMFFTSIGLEKEAKYFNSGVMLIDLQAWRQANITKRCLEFAEKYPAMLLTADQTILNFVFYKNNFCELDRSYNHGLYPISEQISPDGDDSIFHFIGSPKPWDFMGELVHKNYPLFYSVLRKTEFSRYKTFSDFSVHKFKRTLRLSRSYYNCIKAQSN